MRFGKEEGVEGVEGERKLGETYPGMKLLRLLPQCILRDVIHTASSLDRVLRSYTGGFGDVAGAAALYRPLASLRLHASH